MGQNAKSGNPGQIDVVILFYFIFLQIRWNPPTRRGEEREGKMNGGRGKELLTSPVRGRGERIIQTRKGRGKGENGG